MLTPVNSIVKDTLVSRPTEGGGVEPQWLMEPLTDLTGRVQYPLATPSRLRPAIPKLTHLDSSIVMIVTNAANNSASFPY